MTSQLEETLKELNKRYGIGTVISGDTVEEDVEVVDSGSLTLNIATGVGGIPVGKLIEMFGPESSGKSTLALHMIAEFQRVGKRAVLCDAEQSFDRKYATALGVNMDDLIIVQPECMEDGYNSIEEIVRSGEVGLVVIDSHTALIPKKLVDGEVGDAVMAIQARINSQAIGKLKPLLKKNNCTILAISQTRTNIGGYGDPNISTGGMAYKFYSDMRIRVSKAIEKDAGNNRTTVLILKNKCAIPYGKAIFDIEWGKGISRVGEIIELGVAKGLIVQKGSWFCIGEEKWQGQEKLRDHILADTELYNELKTKVL